MSASDHDSKSIRVPTFDGDEDHYQKWWMRFKACATLSGFSQALIDARETDPPNDYEEADALTGTDDDTLKKKKAMLRNDKAIASFTLAFTTNELLDIIMESQTDEWPDGQAWTIMKKLQGKCRPSDATSMVD